MKTYLENATSAHVQSFALELGPQDDVDAQKAGYQSAALGYDALLEQSAQAWALCSCGHPGRVIAMLGVLSKSWADDARLWVHTSKAFNRAGIGALRQVRHLFHGLALDYGELLIDVDSENSELVRLADWLGFKHLGFIERAGRPFHHAVLRAG